LENLIPPECRACEANPEELYRDALRLLKNTENESVQDLECFLRFLTITCRPGITLESKLWAILDMRKHLLSFLSEGVASECLTELFELVWHGAKEAHAMLATADGLLRAAFGPSPSLDLASLKGYSTFSLRVFALADVVRSIALRIPTTFNYVFRLSDQDRRDSEAIAYDNVCCFASLS
jgi:hypothetical protein